jgi:hypothetical protein
MDSRVPIHGSVQGAEVRARDGRLALGPSEVIRHGNVATTVLGPFRPIARVLPRNVRFVEENKQLSDGVLDCAGLVSSGFSVNEVVTWL